MTVPIYGSESTTECVHCNYGHGTIICNCGHTHAEHISLSGCGVIMGFNEQGLNVYCACTCYSQTGLRQIGETTREFNKRVGYVTA